MNIAIVDHSHPKNIESIFTFPEFVPACKKSVYPIVHFWDTVNFKSPVTRMATPIFDHVHTKTFDQLLILVNWYHHAKNQFIQSVDFLDKSI